MLPNVPPPEVKSIPVVPEIFDRPERRGKRGGLVRQGLCLSVLPEEAEVLRNFARSKEVSLSVWARRVLMDAVRKELGYEED
jgi:hypothetical protein